MWYRRSPLRPGVQCNSILEPEGAEQGDFDWPVGQLDLQVGIEGDHQEEEDGELGGDQREASEEETRVETQTILHAENYGERDGQGAHAQISHRQAHDQVVGDAPQLSMQVDGGAHKQVDADNGHCQETLQNHERNVQIHGGCWLHPPDCIDQWSDFPPRKSSLKRSVFFKD